MNTAHRIEGAGFAGDDGVAPYGADQPLLQPALAATQDRVALPGPAAVRWGVAAVQQVLVQGFVTQLGKRKTLHYITF